MKGRYLPSLLAAIGEVIEQHMIEIGFLSGPAEIGDRARRAVAIATGQEPGGAKPSQCPRCGSAALIKQEGCDLCTACGYSKCS